MKTKKAIELEVNDFIEHNEPLCGAMKILSVSYTHEKEVVHIVLTDSEEYKTILVSLDWDQEVKILETF